MNCKEFNNKLSEYIDDELNDIEMRKMTQHLIECEKCRFEYEFMIEIMDNSKEELELPKNYHDSLCKKIENEKNNIHVMKNKKVKIIEMKKFIPYLSVAAALVLLVTTYQNDNYGNTMDEAKILNYGLEYTETESDMSFSESMNTNKSVRGIAMDSAPSEYTAKSASNEIVNSNMKISLNKVKNERSSKIIKNANINIILEEYDSKLEMIQDYLVNANGYIENKEINKQNDLKSGHVRIKIPKNEFEKCIEYIRTLGDVRNELIFSDDITDEYYDSQLRLANMRKQNQRYKELLNKGETVEELLKIEKEMNRIAIEIEILEGKLKSWDNLVEYSKIQLMITEVKSLKPIIETPNKSLGQRIQENFVINMNDMIRNIELFIIKITGNIIYIVLGGVLLIIGFKIYKNKKFKKRDGGEVNEEN